MDGKSLFTTNIIFFRLSAAPSGNHKKAAFVDAEGVVALRTVSDSKVV